MKQNLNGPLKDLKKEENALDQSMGLNRILLTMIDNQKMTHKWVCAILIISLLCNVAMASIFVIYESQFTSQSTTTTITQDTGEGEGNNIYQSGEMAQYIQGDSSEEVTPGGEANNNYYSDHSNPQE